MTDQELIPANNGLSRSQSDMSVVRIRKVLQEFQKDLELSHQKGEKIDRVKVLSDLCKVMSSVIGNKAGLRTLTTTNDKHSEEMTSSGESPPTIGPSFTFEQSWENHSQVTTVNLKNDRENLQLKMIVDDDERLTETMPTGNSGTIGSNASKNEDSVVCIDVDEKDTIEIQQKMLPREVMETETKPLDSNTKSKAPKWFSFKNKSQKRKKGSVVHKNDKSLSSKFTKEVVNEKEETKNNQNNGLSSPEKNKNVVDELASNAVRVPVGRESRTKNKMKLKNRLRSFSPSKRTKKKQQEMLETNNTEDHRDSVTSEGESKHSISSEKENTINLVDNSLEARVEMMLNQGECIEIADSPPESNEGNKAEDNGEEVKVPEPIDPKKSQSIVSFLKRTDSNEEKKVETCEEDKVPEPIDPRKSQSIVSFLKNRSKHKSVELEDSTASTLNNSLDTSLDSFTHVNMGDTSIEITLLEENTASNEIVFTDVYLDKSNASAEDGLVSLSLNKPLGLIFEEVNKSASSGVLLKDIGKDGSAYRLKNSSLFPGMKLISIMNENVESCHIEDIMDKMVDAPSPVSIEMKHTASSNKKIPSKTKKDRIFFKSLKNRSKENEFDTSPKNGIPPSKPTENKNSETAPITTMRSTEELESLFCYDDDAQGTEQILGNIGKSSTFPVRNRSSYSLSSSKDQHRSESARESSFFSNTNSDASYDHYTLSTRENSQASGASHLSDLTSELSLRRSKTRSSVSGRRRSRLEKNRTSSFQTIEESANDVEKDSTENRVVALPSTTSSKIQYILTRKVNGDTEEQSDDEEMNKETRSDSSYSVLEYDDTSVASNMPIMDFVKRVVACIDNIGVIEEGDGETQTMNQSYTTGSTSLKSSRNSLIYRNENTDSCTLDERTSSLLSDGSSKEENHKMKQIAEDQDEEIASLLDNEDDDASNRSYSTPTLELAAPNGLCAM